MSFPDYVTPHWPRPGQPSPEARVKQRLTAWLVNRPLALSGRCAGRALRGVDVSSTVPRACGRVPVTFTIIIIRRSGDSPVACKRRSPRRIPMESSIVSMTLGFDTHSEPDKRQFTRRLVLRSIKPAGGCPPGKGTPCTWRSPEQPHRRDAGRPPAAPYRCPPRYLPR
jgi:hypothetical protein